MGGELVGLGGEAPWFRPQRSREVQGACPPRFRPRCTRGVRGAEPPGLQVHGAPTGVLGLPPGLVG